MRFVNLFGGFRVGPCRFAALARAIDGENWWSSRTSGERIVVMQKCAARNVPIDRCDVLDECGARLLKTMPTYLASVSSLRSPASGIRHPSCGGFVSGVASTN